MRRNPIKRENRVPLPRLMVVGGTVSWLLALVGIALTWMASYDTVSYAVRDADSGVSVCLVRGSVYVTTGLQSSLEAGRFHIISSGSREAPRTFRYRLQIWIVGVSTLLFGLSVVAGKRGWRAWILYRRRKGGKCIICGYDLQASPDVCPECGNGALDPVEDMDLLT